MKPVLLVKFYPKAGKAPVPLLLPLLLLPALLALLLPQLSLDPPPIIPPQLSLTPSSEHDQVIKNLPQLQQLIKSFAQLISLISNSVCLLSRSIFNLYSRNMHQIPVGTFHYFPFSGLLVKKQKITSHSIIFYHFLLLKIV